MYAMTKQYYQKNDVFNFYKLRICNTIERRQKEDSG